MNTQKDQSTRYAASLRAAHATGLECPKCDRGPSVISADPKVAGRFYCHGCGHEWGPDEE